jgi:hypothetical protein
MLKGGWRRRRFDSSFPAESNTDQMRINLLRADPARHLVSPVLNETDLTGVYDVHLGGEKHNIMHIIYLFFASLYISRYRLGIIV